jgi:glucokinase
MTARPGDSISLVADIGGTNARFAIAQRRGDGVHVAHVTRYATADHPSFEDAVGAYLSSIPAPPMRAAFAVAGPVDGQRAVLTNSPWRIDAASLQARFGWRSVRLVNDFIGQALGATLLPASALATIMPGVADPQAPIAVLGPGTGLGLALLVPQGDGYRVIPTEGGHTAFAPATAREAAVAAHLRSTLGYVSFESIASGLGLVQVYAALHALDGVAHTLAGHPAFTGAEISARAAIDPYADEAMAILFSALGTFVGNVVLTTGAKGGVYLGGGILPKVRAQLESSCFAQRVAERGMMAGYMVDVPVRLILADDTALLGAAAAAERTD